MLLALAASLHPPRRVHGSRSTGPWVEHETWKERLLDGRLGQLLRGYEVEAAAFELVAADVAHLRHRVLVWHAEVQDVRAGRGVGVLAVESRDRHRRTAHAGL